MKTNITTIQERAILHTEGTHFDKRCQPVICVDEMKAFNSGLDAADCYDTTGGAAFRDENDNLDETGYEVSRLLKNVAEDIKYGHKSGNLIDINGNRVGCWKYD